VGSGDDRTAHHLFGKDPAKVLVGLDERLTFRRVDDEDLGLRIELDVRGKARAARADNAGVLY
jgi:hypothetical protein